jgi:hypothetical protein
MPVSISMIVVGSQLVVAIADRCSNIRHRAELQGRRGSDGWARSRSVGKRPGER